MKTIGILGGMSSASTALYYKQLNLGVRARLGGLHSAQILLRSLDFALIAELQAKNDWSTAGALLNQEALALERGGAELLLLATNTMHKVSSLVTAGLEIPFLHIGDATARAITAAGLSHPGLIATSYTMSETFYTGRLKEAGLHTVLPVEDDRELTHRIIYEELCKDIITTRSRRRYEGIAERLVSRGADCVIFGCTEVGMLLDEKNVSVPVFDSTSIHCEQALDFALTDVKTPSRQGFWAPGEKRGS
uniref:Aspartate racemase n=1 Tax=Haptolina ericina TaxID=156174 RepID=A0A7S3F448_9EUKA|mmetsp:Transcript_51909/g.116536  ORF Transcript_51909/g.116536 Transcript_51909/m.116536 type:complete len:249 (+) Transcript_51909:56-802(+)